MKRAVQNIKNSNLLLSVSDAVSNRDTSRRISGVREWHTTRYNRAGAGSLIKFMKSKLKIYLILFIYAICFIYLWGECFRGLDSNQITCGIGLVFTFISAYFIQKQYDFKIDVWQKLFLVILMIGHSCYFFRNDGLRLFLFSPFF